MEKTNKELLEEIARLRKENERLKENLRAKPNINIKIKRENAFDSIKNLLKRDTQSYQSLANKMNLSDRTLRTFVQWDSRDTSDKTLWILWDYFTEEFKNSYKDLALYRAYTNARKPEDREQIFKRLNSLFDEFLNEFYKIYDKKIYKIEEKWIVARWEVVDGWFLVHKESQGVRNYVKSANVKFLDKHRNDLISQWIIIREWDKIVFLQDYKFKSPSWAANIIVWSSANWRIRWKSEWITLKDSEPDLYKQLRKSNEILEDKN